MLGNKIWDEGWAKDHIPYYIHHNNYKQELQDSAVPATQLLKSLIFTPSSSSQLRSYVSITRL